MKKVFLILIFVTIGIIIFSKNVDAQSFVYVENGNFYEADGTPLYLSGTNLRTGWWATENLIIENDFKRMAEVGINAVRLCVSPKLLEPLVGVYNESYLNYLDQMIAWAKKYNLYVSISYHWGGSPYSIPTWVNNWEGDMFNKSVEDRINAAWNLLSDRWKDEIIILMYELGWNEPNFYGAFRNSDVFSSTEELTSWQNWLKKTYGSISNLNNTWTTGSSTYDNVNFLNGTAGEDQWSGIRLPYAVRTKYIDFLTTTDMRAVDWTKWLNERYYNKTKRFAETIRLNDNNHLISYNPLHAGFSRIPTYRNMMIPDEVEVISYHNYVTNYADGLFYNNNTARLEFATYGAKNFFSFNRSYAIVDTETVDFPLENPDVDVVWFKSYSVADYGQGLDGWFFWTWNELADMKNDPTRQNLTTKAQGDGFTWKLIEDNAKMWREGTEWSPEIAYISSRRKSSGRVQIATMLTEYGLQVQQIPAGKVTPELFNNFKIIIYDGKDTGYLGSPNTTVNALKTWVDSAPDRYLLLLGLLGSDDYRTSSSNFQKWGLWEGHIVKNGVTSLNRYNASRNEQTITINVSSSNFGDLTQYETFSYTKSSADDWAHCDYNHQESDYIDMDGAETIIWDKTNDLPMMWRVGRTVYFTDLPDLNAYQQGFRKVLVAFLKWTGQVTVEEGRISDYGFKGQNHIALWERHNSASTGKLNITGLSTGNYVLYNHKDYSVFTKSSSELSSGLDISLDAYDYQLFTIKPNTNPTWVDYTTNAKIKNEVWDPLNEKLNLTIENVIPFIVKIYSPNKPTKISINGTNITEVYSLNNLTYNTWFYNETEKMLHINIYQYNLLPRLYVDGTLIKDSFGNEIRLAGFNGHPYHHEPWAYQLYEDDVKWIVDRGFNAIRLTMNWDKIESQEGIYNQTYLELLDNVISWSEKYGIYVILDMHQWAFSPLYNEYGQGFPEWVCQAYATALDCATTFWAGAGSVDQVGSGAWMQDKFINIWKFIASRYAGRNVVAGYDLFNEPHNPFLQPNPSYIPILAPQVMSFYNDSLIPAIRSVDSDTIIIASSIVTYDPDGGASYNTQLNHDNIIYGRSVYDYTSSSNYGAYDNASEVPQSLRDNLKNRITLMYNHFVLDLGRPFLMTEIAADSPNQYRFQEGCWLWLNDTFDFFSEVWSSPYEIHFTWWRYCEDSSGWATRLWQPPENPETRVIPDLQRYSLS